MSDQETAIQRHDRMVREEREQAERIRSDGGEDADLWKPHARRFGGAAHTRQHPAVAGLVSLIGSSWRVIDVGAGGGRITVALAEYAAEVVAVEPSPAMRDVLEATARDAGVANVRVMASAWEEADVDPAELVFAANVTYGIQNIEPFIRKIDAMATRRAALVTFADPPQHRIAPFWRFVHGSNRLRLPCRAELLDVVQELGAEPQVISLPAHEPQPFGTRGETRDELRRRLFVGAGTPADAKIDEAIDALTEERDGLLWSTQEQPNERSIVWWVAGRMASPR